MVTLHKDSSTPVEHRYADRFLSRTEFQWESQASTAADSAKARRIRNHVDDGRLIHLFVRLRSRQPMVYCGTINYLRDEGEKPLRVWFERSHPLPEGLCGCGTRECWDPFSAKSRNPDVFGSERIRGMSVARKHPVCHRVDRLLRADPAMKRSQRNVRAFRLRTWCAPLTLVGTRSFFP